VSESNQLLVRRIKNGTVIDHIDPGKALMVLKALSITGQEGNVITVALNVPSNKHLDKDIVKIEGKYLEQNETDKLALLTPNATINIIKDYKVIEKRNLEVPNRLKGIFKCPNAMCVTNNEEIVPIIELVDKTKMIFRCRYCNRSLSRNDISF
jgi:aspartate carbamoyltransferase regulatory subunit